MAAARMASQRNPTKEFSHAEIAGLKIFNLSDRRDLDH
jgi:hypothetical protein